MIGLNEQTKLDEQTKLEDQIVTLKDKSVTLGAVFVSDYEEFVAFFQEVTKIIKIKELSLSSIFGRHAVCKENVHFIEKQLDVSEVWIAMLQATEGYSAEDMMIFLNNAVCSMSDCLETFISEIQERLASYQGETKTTIELRVKFVVESCLKTIGELHVALAVQGVWAKSSLSDEEKQRQTDDIYKEFRAGRRVSSPSAVVNAVDITTAKKDGLAACISLGLENKKLPPEDTVESVSYSADSQNEISSPTPPL